MHVARTGMENDHGTTGRHERPGNCKPSRHVSKWQPCYRIGY
jgi:hypothetical protein